MVHWHNSPSPGPRGLLVLRMLFHGSLPFWLSRQDSHLSGWHLKPFLTRFTLSRVMCGHLASCCGKYSLWVSVSFGCSPLTIASQHWLQPQNLALGPWIQWDQAENPSENQQNLSHSLTDWSNLFKNIYWEPIMSQALWILEVQW